MKENGNFGRRERERREQKDKKTQSIEELLMLINGNKSSNKHKMVFFSTDNG